MSDTIHGTGIREYDPGPVGPVTADVPGDVPLRQEDTGPPGGRVLVGVDGSEHSLRALEIAAADAARRGAVLEVLCGWPWDREPGPAGRSAESGRMRYRATRAVVEEAANRARAHHPGLRVVSSLTTESAPRALVHFGSSAALTVVGARGYGGFAGLLIGSVSLRVASHTEGPLLVVRREPPRPHGPVLVGIESEADTDAVAFGFEEARRRGVPLRLLHAWPHTEDGDTAEEVPRLAAAPFRDVHPGIVVQPVHVTGRPAPVLVEASRTASVLILATHRRPRRLGLRLGPVTHAVLQHAHCPVLLVPVG
ncbi:universal stress protein [Streptomyces calidiresistens]|uniref:Universal stress protein n=1 Tax=Streptomyces calidiresistens TaxID=1485586 RepID=A0A7W3XUQ5_9ACTN|nr:universal stress protein [Streptomyces calidiresistens]MBB0228170.1 universal stress protein [Streptomyces calidiresistens]